MSGLVAILARGRGASVGAEEVERLAATYEVLRGAGLRRALTGGERVRLIRLSPPGVDGDSGIQTDGLSWAAWAGVAQHQGSLLRAPLEELDGAFALVRYDGESDEVVVASDPFGMQALYVLRRGAKVYVSTSALALAKHLGAKPSVLGVFTYLRIGRNFGPNTHWEGIERLEPATRLRFSAGAAERSRYWRPPIEHAVARLSFERTVSHCVDAVVDTLRRYLAGGPPTWSDLTGGFDTRLMALSLSRAGVDFHANTVGRTGDDDVRIAAHVASRAGWPWARFEVPDDWDRILPGRLAHALAWGDGHLDVLQLSEVLWHHERKHNLHRSLLIGGGGEHFRNSAWKQEFLRAGRSRDVNWDHWLTMRLLPPIDASVFSRDLSGEVRANLRRRMEAWIEPYSDERNTAKLDMLYAYKTTGHFGAYRSAACAFLDAQLPLYFKPIFVAATSSNFRFRNQHRLLRHMMMTLDPGIAAVETTDGGPAEPWRLTNIHRFSPYYFRIGRKAVNKVAQKAVGRTLLPAGAPVSPPPPGARIAAVRHLEANGGFRYEDLRLAPLLSRRGFEEVLRRAGDPQLRDASLLGHIITAELALRASNGTLER